MKHRHLVTSAWTLAAIDSCICRGTEADYAELRQAAFADPEIIQKIRKVCESVLAKDYEENYDCVLYEAWLNWTKTIFEKLQAVLDAPLADNPALKKLLASKAPWE
ncbi:hypothetical protein ACUUL3_04890 [Thiovibrio sp. JS02]